MCAHRQNDLSKIFWIAVGVSVFRMLLCMPCLYNVLLVRQIAAAKFIEKVFHFPPVKCFEFVRKNEKFQQLFYVINGVICQSVTFNSACFFFVAHIKPLHVYY